MFKNLLESSFVFVVCCIVWAVVLLFFYKLGYALGIPHV